jgi:hypothetical protein
MKWGGARHLFSSIHDKKSLRLSSAAHYSELAGAQGFDVNNGCHKGRQGLPNSQIWHEKPFVLGLAFKAMHMEVKRDFAANLKLRRMKLTLQAQISSLSRRRLRFAKVEPPKNDRYQNNAQENENRVLHLLCSSP